MFDTNELAIREVNLNCDKICGTLSYVCLLIFLFLSLAHIYFFKIKHIYFMTSFLTYFHLFLFFLSQSNTVFKTLSQ